MKKIFSFLAVALLALGFTACEDIPAPYGIEDEILGDGSKTLPYVQSFENSLGAYKSYTLSGEGRWINDHKAAVASGYNSADQTTTAGSYILVSPEISTMDADSVHFVMDYVLRYFKTAENQQVWITKNFDESKPAEGWTQIPVTLESVNDWNDVKQIDVNIPTEFIGGKIRLALYYNTPDTKGSTWQVKSLSVLKGAAGGAEDKPAEGVKELPYTEPFATEMGAFKNYTTSGSGAWAFDNRGFAKASGFTAPEQPAIQGTYYMVSPEISLAGKTEAHLSYEYINSFNDNPLNHQFMINVAFDESKPAEGWVALKADHEKTTSWTDWKKADIQIPAEYMGKNIRVAFRYECSSDKASTFEVKNFKAEEGKAESGNTPQPEEGVQQLPYGEKFFDSLGLFKNFTTSGAGEWKIDFNTAKAAGYDNQTQVTTDGTYYLVSPEISLANQTEVHLAYEYIYRYGVAPENQQVLISTSFNEAAPTEGWTLLNGEHTEGTDWTTFSKADIQIPAEYMGKTIRVAFRYICENQKGSTWEVKNFSIAAGKIGEGGNEGGGDTPDTGDVKAANGDFETWVDGLPNNWKTASSACNARLSQSTDAHSGKYSVLVEGYSGANKRLGYKEIELQPGTYNVKFYVKAATAEGGSARAGYAIVKDGVVANSDYKYGDFINNLTTDKWVEVNYSFEVSTVGIYSMLIMNAKKPGKDILVDDYTLTDASGNAIIK